MKFKAKEFRKNNYFVLYGYKYEDPKKLSLYDEDEIVCYFDNFKELSKYINYSPRKLAYEFNSRNTDIIDIFIEGKKYKLATFCDE